jgi:protein tyrosine/serine phosphatase
VRRVVTIVSAAVVAVSLFAVPYTYSEVRETHLRNFRVVEDGVLYRSAQLSPAGLERVVHDYGIRTIVSFRDAEEGKSVEPPDKWEETLAQRLGITHVRFPLRHWWPDATGAAPADANVEKFLAIMRDKSKHPVLVHCYRGVHRTGTYCAIFRMECHRWSNAEAMAELKALGYDKLDEEDDVRGYLERYAPTRAACRP